MANSSEIRENLLILITKVKDDMETFSRKINRRKKTNELNRQIDDLNQLNELVDKMFGDMNTQKASNSILNFWIEKMESDRGVIKMRQNLLDNFINLAKEELNSRNINHSI